MSHIAQLNDTNAPTKLGSGAAITAWLSTPTNTTRSGYLALSTAVPADTTAVIVDADNASAVTLSYVNQAPVYLQYIQLPPRTYLVPANPTAFAAAVQTAFAALGGSGQWSEG